MSNLNRCFLIGRLTRDPELTFTPKGTAVGSLGLAINRTWKNEAGQTEEATTFIDCTLWGRTAEIANQYLGKGSSVFIEGRLEYNSWEKDGVKHSKLKVVGETLQFLGSKESAGSHGPARMAPSQSVPNPAAPPPRPHVPEPYEPGVEIPF
jgi:single-strand DNA-binding protein